MKKSMSIVIMLMLVISMVPIAFAEEDVDTSAEAVEEEVIEDVVVEEVEVDAGDAMEDNGVKPDRPRAAIAEQRIENAKERAASARLRAADARDKVQDVRQDIRAKRMSDCICTTDYNPVCGDGVTYGNRCEALCHDAEDITAGACEGDRQAGKKVRLQRIHDKFDGLTDDQKERLKKVTRAKLAEFEDLTEAEVREKLGKIKTRVVKNAGDLRDRVVDKERMGELRERFDNAKERFGQARDRYQSARDEYRDAIDAGDKEAALEKAKEVLQNSGEAILSHLDRLSARISENENIADEDVDAILSRIDNQKDEVTLLLDDLEVAETPEEVRAVAQELKAKLRLYKHKMKAFAQWHVVGNIKSLVHKGQVLEKKLDSILERAENAGIEVDVEDKVADFSEHIATAEAHVEELTAVLREARDSEDSETAEGLVEQARVLFSDAKDEISSAHQVLRDIVQTIKEAGADATVDSEEAVEVEVEEE